MSAANQAELFSVLYAQSSLPLVVPEASLPWKYIMSLRTTLLQYSKPFGIQVNVTSFEAIQVEPLDGLCAWRRTPGAAVSYTHLTLPTKQAV